MTLYLHLIPVPRHTHFSCFGIHTNFSCILSPITLPVVQLTNSKQVFLTLPLYTILQCKVYCNWRLICIVDTGVSCHKDYFPVSSAINFCSVFSCVLCRTAVCLTPCYALCFSCLRVHPPLLIQSRKINNILCCSAWCYI